MADKKVTALTDLSTSIASDDLFMVIDDPTGTPINKKVTVKNFLGNVTHSTVAADATALSLVRSVVTVASGQATSGELVSGEFTVNHAGATTTTAIGNLYGIKATAQVSDADNNITTNLAAIYGVVDVAASADSLGTAGGHVLSLDIDCTTAPRSVAVTSYISMGDKFATGTNPATYLFDVFPSDARNGSLTFETGASYGCYTNAATATTKDGTLKVRVNGEVKYIQLFNAS